MRLPAAVPERWARYYLGNAPSLVWLLVVNATAFLVGVRFYVETMPGVETFLWPLYGDSPTALALATLSLVTLLPNLGRPLSAAPANRPLAYLHTLAFVWLVKYGLWTVVALNLGFSRYFGFGVDALWAYWGIILTHVGFVVEALLVPRYARTTPGALATALGLLLVNDVYDYWFGGHPPLRYDLVGTVGVVLPAATVALSFGAVWAAARLIPRLDDPRPSD